MRGPEEIRTIGVVGAGLVGGSWAAYFRAVGRDVRVFDPSPDAEERVRLIVESAESDLGVLGKPRAQELGRLVFCSSIAECVASADFVQENGPESLSVKRELVCEIEESAAADVIIASSTSSLLASDIQRDCKTPERVLVAHPFNPPHLLPLVEVVRGAKTSEGAQDAAVAFYRSIGKEPIRVKKEAIGHVANRMTAALWRESVHIVAEGIADVEDVDRAIRFGPGLRWAIDGPHMTYHLGGGKGGLQYYLDHLGPAQESRWATLGAPTLSTSVKRSLVEGIAKEAAGRSYEALSRRRDHLIVAILKAIQEIDGVPPNPGEGEKVDHVPASKAQHHE